MRFRSTAITLGLVLLSLGTAHAQNRDQQGNPGDRRMQVLFKDITLTPAQKTRVDSIMHRDREAGGREGNPDQRRELFRKQLADVRLVLNPDQQAVFDRNVSEMRSRMEGRGSGDSGRTRP